MSRQTDIFRYINSDTAAFGRNRPIRNLQRLTDSELRDVAKLRAFNREKANGHCTLCMRVLYPEEQKYRGLSEEWLICNSWNINPIVNSEGLHMVCAFHLTNNGTSSNNRHNTRRISDGEELEPVTPENLQSQYVYPGIPYINAFFFAD